MLWCMRMFVFLRANIYCFVQDQVHLPSCNVGVLTIQAADKRVCVFCRYIVPVLLVNGALLVALLVYFLSKRHG